MLFSLQVRGVSLREARGTQDKNPEVGTEAKPRGYVMLTGLLLGSCPASFLFQPRPKDVPRDSAPHIGLGPPTSSNNPDNDSADMLSELSDEARLQLRVSLPKCVKVFCHRSMARLLRIGGTF